MSVNYASGLSHYEHKGKCGQPEKLDPPDVVASSVKKLADMIAASKHMVVITGAGISTSAGIPDFRGPKGVWTMEEKGQTPEIDVTFETARPTVTHLALVALEQKGYLKHLISQNVDGLHLRSGFPRNCLSELHGNMFVEECDTCKTQYIRTKAVPTMARNYTGSACSQKKHRGLCRGRLRDTILDWEDELPLLELNNSDKHSRAADLCLSLGTTLQILPCGNMPMLTKKNRGQVVIINLQSTRHDKKCDLRIHAYVDDIMSGVCEHLGIPIPVWTKPIIILKSIHTPPAEKLVKCVIDDCLVSEPPAKETDSSKQSELKTKRGIAQQASDSILEKPTICVEIPPKEEKEDKQTVVKCESNGLPRSPNNDKLDHGNDEGSSVAVKNQLKEEKDDDYANLLECKKPKLSSDVKS